MFLNIYNNLENLQIICSQFSIINIIVIFTAMLLAKLLLTLVSYYSIIYFDYKISYKKMFYIYNFTQMAKYIPGSIWQFVGKASLYKTENIPKSIIKKAMALEILLIIISSFSIGVVLLFLFDNFLDTTIIINNINDYIIIYSSIFIFLFFILFTKTAQIYIKTIVKQYLLNVKLFLILTCIWLLLGLSLYVSFTSILIFDLKIFMSIVGLFSIAYVAGFLVPFAPAGIGIREAILVAGLSSILTLDEAIVIASLNRVFYILVELIIMAIILIQKRYAYKL